MMLAAPLFESLVDQIYEAAIYPDRWPHMLHNLSMASQSAGGIILLRRSDNWIGWRFSEGMRGAKQFMESDAPARSKTTERLLNFGRAGFVAETELFSDEEFLADSFAAEWATPNHLHHCAATAVQTPSQDLVVVHMQREVGDKAFDGTDLAVLDVFRPHLARAGLLAARLQLERFNAIARGLELVGLPAAVLDRFGRLLCANKLAEAMAGHIGWGSQNRLHLLDRKADARLQDALLRTQQAGAFAGSSFPSKSRTDGVGVVHLIPVTGAARDLFEGGFSLLLVTPVGAKPAHNTALLQGLFDLPPAEADIATRIASGHSPEAIAQARQSAIETVRAQIKSILAKTNTNRQAELAALLAGIPDIPSR